MENFQITDRYTSYFNKEVLCVGEPAKIVVAPMRTIVDYEILLKIETPEGPILNRPETFLLEERDRGRRLISIATDSFKSGLYFIRVYVVPAKYRVAEVIPEEYAIAGHAFQILGLDQYEQYLQELFGEGWDEPVYCDSKEWNQLSEFFVSYDASAITDFTIKHIQDRQMRLDSERRRDTYSRYDDSWKYDSLDGLVLSRIVEVIDAAMQFEVPLPFLEYHNVEVTGLPHVNLTKYIWLLNVLGSTWTDLFFFSQLVRFDINASEESIDLTVSSSLYTVEEPPEWLTPSLEPPLFHVVRKTIQAGLNCELSYDANKGVTLMVTRNQSFLSMSAH